MASGPLAAPPGPAVAASRPHVRSSSARCAFLLRDRSGQSGPAGRLHCGHHGRDHDPSIRAIQPASLHAQSGLVQSSPISHTPPQFSSGHGP